MSCHHGNWSWCEECKAEAEAAIKLEELETEVVELKAAYESLFKSDGAKSALITQLTTERDAAVKVVEAAKNLRAVKGRHHSEIACIKLYEALDAIANTGSET